MKALSAACAVASLTGCTLCNVLPPLPSGECTAFVGVTALTATDAGTAEVTFGCNQGSASACDGGVLPACPATACIEVDWVGVAASFNGNCSAASPKGLAAAVACTALVGDAGTTLSFVEVASVPAPELVFAHVSDGGTTTTCDATCAQAAVNCACDSALSGNEGSSCTTLK